MPAQAAPVARSASSKSANRDKSTRAEILEAAARLIVEDGYAACTMRSLSERVKIKAGSMYYHFNSKEEIVVEIMNIGVETLLDEVQRRVAELPPKSPFKKKFECAVEAHVACKVDADIPYMRVYEHLPPIIKRESRAMRHKYADFWVAMLLAAKKSGDVRSDLDLDIFVPFFLAGLNRIPEWFNGKKMSEKKVSREVANIFLSGIRPAGAR